MGKLEGVIKSEIIRLAKREVRKTSLPLGRDVRLLKAAVSQLRKTTAALQHTIGLQLKNLEKGKPLAEATPEEVKASRLSPRLIRSLRVHLGITQKELAALAGVTVGAIHQWESGMFKPTMKKKGILISLRKLGRREVKNLLQKKAAEAPEKKASPRPVKKTKKIGKK
jgi:DNA-binding transcriptional regulator YiaG